jgi:hypothetical protein
MKTASFIMGLASIVCLVAPSACGGGKGEALGEVTAADGQYTVTKAELADRFPLDCRGGGGPDCLRKDTDEQFVVVGVEPQFRTHDPILAADYCLGHVTYIVADDGSKAPCYASDVRFGPEEMAEELFLLFRAPASAEGFALVVPDNPPVYLGK